MSIVEELKEDLKDTKKLVEERTEILRSVMKHNDELLKSYKELKDDIYFYQKHTYKLQYNNESFKLENKKLKKEIEDLKKRFLK